MTTAVLEKQGPGELVARPGRDPNGFEGHVSDHDAEQIRDPRHNRKCPARTSFRSASPLADLPSGLPGYAGTTRGGSSPQQRTLPTRANADRRYAQNQDLNGNIVPSTNGDIDVGQPTGPRRVSPNGTRGKKGTLGIPRYFDRPNTAWPLDLLGKPGIAEGGFCSERRCL